MASRDLRTERWKRLLVKPPEPTPLSVDDYVLELNRRLRADPSYRDGTRFVVATAQSDGLTSTRGGPTWEGPESMKPVVYRIVQSVIGVYSVEMPFFSDR